MAILTSFRNRDYVILDYPVRSLEQLRCPICLQLRTDPVWTSCGHLFCDSCIEGLQSCAICRQEDFTISPDMGSVQVITSLRVKCPNASEGCEWQGELGDAEDHLARKCQASEVLYLCRCGEQMDRDHVQNHTENHCPYRPFSCPHCGLRGVYRKLSSSAHYAACEGFPLLCPGGCRELVPRKHIEHHLSTECPEEYVACKYAMFGCDAAVRRREMNNRLTHATRHIREWKNALKSVAYTAFGLAYLSRPGTQPNLSFLPLSFRPWLQKSPTCYPRPPWVVKLEGFKEKKRRDVEWISTPVYSHFGGYTMCLFVYPAGQQDSSHVSVYAHLMKGDNDDNLKFPFKGTITVSLLNQEEDSNHCSADLWSPKVDIVDNVSDRVTTGQVAGDGWGVLEFIPHEDLGYNSAKNAAYLKSDTLFFRVDRFN